MDTRLVRSSGLAHQGAEQSVNFQELLFFFFTSISSNITCVYISSYDSFFNKAPGLLIDIS